MLSAKAITRFAGSIDILLLDLGLTPQALCWRPLRGLTRSLPLPVLTSLLRRLKTIARYRCRVNLKI